MILWLTTCTAGGLGALGRYALTTWGNRHWCRPLPLPTLVINVSAAVLLGAAAGAFSTSTPAFQISAGFFGGFSTYSTITVELAELRQRWPRVALGYLVLAVAGGIGGTGLGWWLTQRYF